MYVEIFLTFEIIIHTSLKSFLMLLTCDEPVNNKYFPVNLDIQETLILTWWMWRITHCQNLSRNNRFIFLKITLTHIQFEKQDFKSFKKLFSRGEFPCITLLQSQKLGSSVTTPETKKKSFKCNM